MRKEEALALQALEAWQQGCTGGCAAAGLHWGETFHLCRDSTPLSHIFSCLHEFLLNHQSRESGFSGQPLSGHPDPSLILSPYFLLGLCVRVRLSIHLHDLRTLFLPLGLGTAC